MVLPPTWFKKEHIFFIKNVFRFKGPFILFCRINSVECPTNFDLCFMLIGFLGLPLFWLDVSSRKFKFVGHSTEIIWQSEIKGPLNYTPCRYLLLWFSSFVFRDPSLTSALFSEKYCRIFHCVKNQIYIFLSFWNSRILQFFYLFSWSTNKFMILHRYSGVWLGSVANT